MWTGLHRYVSALAVRPVNINFDIAITHSCLARSTLCRPTSDGCFFSSKCVRMLHLHNILLLSTNVDGGGLVKLGPSSFFYYYPQM